MIEFAIDLTKYKFSNRQYSYGSRKDVFPGWKLTDIEKCRRVINKMSDELLERVLNNENELREISHRPPYKTFKEWWDLMEADLLRQGKTGFQSRARGEYLFDVLSRRVRITVLEPIFNERRRDYNSNQAFSRFINTSPELKKVYDRIDDLLEQKSVTEYHKYYDSARLSKRCNSRVHPRSRSAR